ncbi:hypothetical protein DFP72DRAFT_857079 [Ephemerocybe angulata]|uniref:Uncharacterized protein n=1 Tax=Ephemerocybe angulata TaxID=980116 RepID=A0A8H6HD64_9AGAR|nr:hypothetical protein DFP72DRAFT_857079 [Tulosesus angulatus]
MLILDEVELDKSSLDILVGLPPYPAALTSLEHFEDVWESIAGALHGRMVYRYKLEMEGQAERMRGASEGDVREELWRMYASLLKQYKQLSAALGATPMYKYSPTEIIIYANVLWAARLISYAVEDIRALICGYSYLLRPMTEHYVDFQAPMPESLLLCKRTILSFSITPFEMGKTCFPILEKTVKPHGAFINPSPLLRSRWHFPPE